MNLNTMIAFNIYTILYLKMGTSHASYYIYSFYLFDQFKTFSDAVSIIIIIYELGRTEIIKVSSITAFTFTVLVILTNRNPFQHDDSL